MNNEVIVLKTSELSLKVIKEINILKNSHWTYGLKSQNIWFKINIKKDDIHIMIKNSNIIIGYNCIRKYNFRGKNNYLFDTFIIINKYRNKGLSKLIMQKNIEFYKNKRLPFILFCNNKLIKFYERFGWKKTDYKKSLINKKNLLIFKA